MIAAAGKGIGRFRGCQEKRTSEVAIDVVGLSSRIPYGHELSGGRGRNVVSLALSYFLLCRASELFACANGLVHPDFGLTRGCLTFFRGDVQGIIEDRARADSVKVLLMASKNRPESTRLYDHPRTHGGRGGGWQDTGWSFRSTGGALRRTPATSRRRPPDDETYGVWGKVITRTEAVVALRMMAASAGKNPAHFALHSGRIGGATKLAAQRMSALQIQRVDRWKSRAFVVYMREVGEGAQKVSATLTREG